MATNDPILSQINYTPPTWYSTNQNTGLQIDGTNQYIGTNPPTTSTLGASTSSGGSSYTDPYAAYGGKAAYDAQVAAYNQGIGNTQSAINRIPTQLNSAYSGVDASYQNALNQLLLGKNQSQTAYQGSKLQSGQDYVGAKNTIGANAGSTLNGLLRLLGSRGAAGSPVSNSREAVARGATIQRADTGNTFGSNNRALDTNWNNYLTGYNNEVSSAGNQRDVQRQNLQSTSQTNQASLLQSLAQLKSQLASYTGGNAASAAQPYLDQANSLLDRTANYSVSPINYNTQAYNAPSLGSYTVNPNATPTVNGTPASNDYFSPYLSALLGKKQPQVA